MLKSHPHNFSKVAFLLIVCISALLIYFFRWTGVDSNQYKYIIDGDGRDYYSYLISIFIDKNLGHQDTGNWYVIQTSSGTINLHTVGVSLLLLPFFCLGYAWALVSGAQLNGLSEPFQKMVSIAALCYASTGLYFLRQLLISYAIKDKIIAIVLALIFFGTNLLNYTVYEPSMSHVYSFSLITVFLFYIKKCFHRVSDKSAFLSVFLLGLITLARPVNSIVILLVPFMASSYDNFISTTKFFFQNKKRVVISVLIFLLIISLQSIVWYVQNKQFIQWSYKGNGFYFTNPQTWLMLFGFNAGFFIYTPLCLVILTGFVPLFSQNKFRFFILLFFILFVFYLFSSYWGYTYWDGLGIRPMVDFYAVFAILFAMLLSYISEKKIKYPVYIFVMTSVFLNLVFCFQYQAGILPQAGMNYKKFKYIFLKTDKSYVNSLGGCMDMPPYAKHIPEISFSHTQKEVSMFNSNEFGLNFEIDSLNIYSNQLYIKVHLKRKEEFPNSSSGALLVASVESENGIFKNYQAYKLNDTPAENCCQWEEFSYGIGIDSKLTPSDKLKIYIWNKSKQSFSISDYSIEVYNYNFKT